MLKKSLATAGVLAALFVINANADDVQPKYGVYFGAKLGISQPDFPSGTQTRTATPDASTTSQSYTYNITKERFAGNVHIGNLWNTSDFFYFGSQIGFTYWGSYDMNGTSNSGTIGANQQTINILLVGQFNLPANFTIGVRGGVGFNASSVSGSLSPTSSTKVTASARHKAAPIVGVSVGYNINKAFQVTLNADRLMADDFKQSYIGFSQRMVRTTMFTVGISYNIGP